MLEVLIERVRHSHPDATFAVFSRDPARVRSLGDDVEQIPVEQTRGWAVVRAAYMAAARILPAFERLLRRSSPGWYASLLRLKARKLANAEALESADFLLVSGGGFITDAFPGQAWAVLERLAAASERGIPFALCGQGIGPLRDAALVEKARSVLPQAKLIAVREGIYSLPLLLELGVSPDKLVVTGDDAIDPAYRARSDRPGNHMGVNFRVADYSGIRQSDVDRIGNPIRAFAMTLPAKLISLPVCFVDSAESASDATTVSRLADSSTHDSGRKFSNTTDALIQLIGGCRVVVSGSYHAAALALAQGVPAVCIYNTEYYGNKFHGLAGEFGSGCTVIDKSEPEFEQRLVAAIDIAWKRADELRPSLLAAAVRQISAGAAAHARLASIMNLASVGTGSRRPGFVA